MYQEKKKGRKAKIFLAVIILAAMLVILLGPVIRKASADLDAQSAVSVEEAVLRSAVQCYAVEGAYPNSLAYLEDHYGLVINHERYIVSYKAFASNIAPTVRVLLRGEEEP